MKTILWLLLLVVIIGGLLLLGNMLRCMSARGETCPPWCLTKKVKCLTSECDKKISCQAPDFIDYVGLVGRWWEERNN